jgi:Na+/H+-dicarboxylate symporter/ABC-type amino acid transport substrate-binding protein
MSLTSRIFAGFLLGIALGLLVGEYTRPLQVIGDIYVGLMQMTVLPYIVFSLIGNIGRLSLSQLRLLSGTALLIYLGLWSFAALTVLLISQTFPELQTARFFSSSMVEPPPRLDWLNLFIPSNPFRSLADNSVPAVVIFCLMFGVGTIGFEGKNLLLDPIGLIAKTLHRVNGMVVRLTPLGVFAITAHACGTMSLEELERLQGYYVSFGVCSLVLTLGILPLLVSGLTPFRYREVLGAARNGLMTAFVTGSALTVIPLLIVGVSQLFVRNQAQDEVAVDFPAFILPLAYPFPNSGNAVALLFIPFAAWFVGDPLSLGNELYTLVLGFFLMFGKVFLAIPFLLNALQIPQDMFQLFLAAGVIAGRLGDAVSSMHYLVFTILATAAMTGVIQIRWRSIARSLGLMAVILSLTVTSLRFLLQYPQYREPIQEKVLFRGGLVDTSHLVQSVVGPSPNPAPLEQGQNRLQRIKQRGTLRSGYQPDNLPYSYTNANGTLVGLDIDLVNKLAKDLGVAVEFVPYQRDTLLEQLNQDHFDLAVSGLTVTLQRSSAMLMTEPYLIVNLGLVVKDHLRNDFGSEEQIARMPKLQLGASQGSFFEQSAKEHFPQATIYPLASPREFFEGRGHTMDALVIHAESGAAWTLLYPDYSVVNPLQHRDSAPLSMAVGGFDLVLEETLNTWITLQKMNGTMDRLFDHWIQGKEFGSHKPRWCILRDVLHWVPHS